jgi:hypothetical protein
MRAPRRRPILRLLVLGAGLAGALACQDTGCDCAAPLEAPMPESQKVYDAVQMRLTPSAFEFVQGRLPEILDRFLEDGLTFVVPRTDMRECMPLIGWPCFNLRICENGCALTAEIVSVSLNRIAPDTLALDARVNLDGTITIRGSLDCDVPIHIRNKPLSANVVLVVDGRDRLLYFDLRDLNIQLRNSDYSLECPWWYDWLMEVLKSTITGAMNSTLQDQLDDTLKDALDGMRCLGCDYYTGGCPAGSACDGDGEYCQDARGCRIQPLGLVGRMDLGELLAEVSPGLRASLDVFLAAGQWESAAVDPLVRNDGLELRMVGGADARRDACVPPPHPGEIPLPSPPPRLGFSDLVPGTAIPYMAGIGVSDRFLDWFLYHAYLSGLLCLNLGSDTVEMLSSGTFSLLMGSLGTLTHGRNTPVKLRLRPERVPHVEIGAGTFTTAPDGQRVIDQPLLHVYLPSLSLDLFVRIDERFERVVTLTQDIHVSLALDFTPQNEIVPLLDSRSIEISDMRASNHELLAEDPAALAQLLPTLLDMALPMLTDQLGAIALPPIEGFELSVAALQGEYPRPGSQGVYEFLGLYANLRLAPLQPTPRRTSARLLALELPPVERMSIRAPGGPLAPALELEVRADGEAPAEYSWRVDGGAWSLFQPGPRLRLSSPRLLLTGPHVVEVRARTPGDYTSLDPIPARVRVEIEAPVATPAAARERPELLPGPAPGPLPASEPQAHALLPSPSEEPHLGCSSPGAHAGGLVLLPLLGLFALRRRR